MAATPVSFMSADARPAGSSSLNQVILNCNARELLAQRGVKVHVPSRLFHCQPVSPVLFPISNRTELKQEVVGENR